MNKGIQRATGDWLNFMNAGDTFISPDILKNIFLNDIIGCDVLHGHGLIGRFGKYGIFRSPQQIDELTFYISAIHHQSAIIKRAIFSDLGNYDTSYKIVADNYHFLKIFQAGYRFKLIDMIVAGSPSIGLSNNKQLCLNELKFFRSTCFSKEIQIKGNAALRRMLIDSAKKQLVLNR